jgi:LemA protein
MMVHFFVRQVAILIIYYILPACGLLLVGWAVWCYNQLVRDRREIDEAWSNIDVQLKRRSDLIPNLVEIVEAYTEHESSLLEDVTEKRSRSKDASGTHERAREESALSDGISNLMARVEDYPELQADEQFRNLHDTLVDVENNLQYARRYYNGTVRDFNVRCEQFPSLIIARMLGFSPEAYFEITLATEREAPDVELEE